MKGTAMTDKNETDPETNASLLTAIEHAAIELRVPNSGTDWIDAMIRKHNRMQLAAMAMQGLLSDEGIMGFTIEAANDNGISRRRATSQLAIMAADALIAELEAK